MVGQNDRSLPETDAEREALLNQRRERQMGKSRSGIGSKLLLMFISVGGITLFLFVLIGPTALFEMLGFIEKEEGQQTSQVGLGVERPSTETAPQLDFVIPEAPKEPEEKPEEPDSELQAQIVALQAQVKKLTETSGQSELTKEDVQNLLEAHSKQVSEHMESQRIKLAEENERLQKELLERQEREKAQEQAQTQREEEQAALNEVEQSQVESSMVVVDGDGSAPSLPGLSGSQVDIAAPDINPKSLSSNKEFLANLGEEEFEQSTAKPLTDPSGTVVQGTIISAVLETAINTELPGSIRAQVMEPVFSYDGTRILMPAGTSLIGSFNPDINISQKRVLIAWDRAITPAGKSVAIGSIGTDKLGRSGTAGNVDNRFFQKVGSAVLISAISAIPSVLSNLGNRDDSSNDNGSGATINIGTSGQQGGGFSSSASQGPAGAVAEQSKGLLEKYLSQPPILRVPQGEEIRIFVNRDLVFK